MRSFQALAIDFGSVWHWTISEPKRDRSSANRPAISPASRSAKYSTYSTAAARPEGGVGSSSTYSRYSRFSRARSMMRSSSSSTAAGAVVRIGFTAAIASSSVSKAITARPLVAGTGKSRSWAPSVTPRVPSLPQIRWARFTFSNPPFEASIASSTMSSAYPALRRFVRGKRSRIIGASGRTMSPTFLVNSAARGSRIAAPSSSVTRRPSGRQKSTPRSDSAVRPYSTE